MTRGDSTGKRRQKKDTFVANKKTKPCTYLGLESLVEDVHHLPAQVDNDNRHNMVHGVSGFVQV